MALGSRHQKILLVIGIWLCAALVYIFVIQRSGSSNISISVSSISSSSSGGNGESSSSGLLARAAAAVGLSQGLDEEQERILAEERERLERGGGVLDDRGAGAVAADDDESEEEEDEEEEEGTRHEQSPEGIQDVHQHLQSLGEGEGDSSNMAPSVCVVVTHCGRTDPLKNALASLLMQTHRRWELVLVVDTARGSSGPGADDRGQCEWSLEDAQEHMLRLMPPHVGVRTTVVENKAHANSKGKNGGSGGGVMAARLVGLRACTSELAAFMDGHDVMMPERLAAEAEAIVQHHAVLVSSNAYYMWASPYYKGRFAFSKFEYVRATHEAMARYHFGTIDKAKKLSLKNTMQFKPVAGSPGIFRVNPQVMKMRNHVVGSSVMVNLTFLKSHEMSFDVDGDFGAAASPSATGGGMGGVDEWQFWRSVLGLPDAGSSERPMLYLSKPLMAVDAYEQGRVLQITTTTPAPPKK